MDDKRIQGIKDRLAESRLRITVIICTLNEAENLPHVLPRIPDWVDEVILVDGHSTDNPIEVAKKLCHNIEVLYQPGKGKGGCFKIWIQARHWGYYCNFRCRWRNAT
jgi:glycosyltransferase involved in cell wall biosynthesis